MPVSAPLRGGVLVLCAILLALGGCRSHRDDVTKSSPEVLYKKAKSSLNSYDYGSAIKVYEQLTARYPFTPQARQARLDLIYAYYRAGEAESAYQHDGSVLDTLDRRVDVVMYDGRTHTSPLLRRVLSFGCARGRSLRWLTGLPSECQRS